MQYGLFSRQTSCFKNNLNALFEFKSKDKYKERCSIDQKETLKEKFI